MFINEQRLNQHDGPFKFPDMITISKLRVLILSSADFFFLQKYLSFFSKNPSRSVKRFESR